MKKPAKTPAKTTRKPAPAKTTTEALSLVTSQLNKLKRVQAEQESRIAHLEKRDTVGAEMLRDCLRQYGTNILLIDEVKGRLTDAQNFLEGIGKEWLVATRDELNKRIEALETRIAGPKPSTAHVLLRGTAPPPSVGTQTLPFPPPPIAPAPPLGKMLGKPPLYLKYRNHRGWIATRRVYPEFSYYGATEWHPEYQWLLKGYDLDKEEERTYAWDGIIKVWHAPKNSEERPIPLSEVSPADETDETKD